MSLFLSFMRAVFYVSSLRDEGRGSLSEVREGVLCSHIAVLSVRLARLAGGSAMVGGL